VLDELIDKHETFLFSLTAAKIRHSFILMQDGKATKKGKRPLMTAQTKQGCSRPVRGCEPSHHMAIAFSNRPWRRSQKATPGLTPDQFNAIYWI